jgi:hypothetical protein
MSPKMSETAYASFVERSEHQYASVCYTPLATKGAKYGVSRISENAPAFPRCHYY